MRADSASHLIRHPITFELFLFVYLVCALLQQKVSIYKTNIHLIDFNLVVFTITILGRRLAWSTLQQLQSHWSSSTHGGGLNVKRGMVAICTLLVIAWSAGRLVQQTSLFNLLFLFYPILLYLSLFGFTLEPRFYRSRFQPPTRFLQHISFSARLKPRNLTHSNTPPGSHTLPTVTTVTSSSSSNSGGAGNASSGLSHRQTNASTNSNANANAHSNSTSLQDHDTSSSTVAQHTQRNELRYTWEYSLLLPATPDEVRHETDILVSDLVVRLKQLLFNSLLCAYYVGFIPMLFADSHLYYDKWWCAEHAFVVWANSFVILSSHLLPPSFCFVLYQCALHLGCWNRCIHDENASVWSPDTIWPMDAVVQWNGESFRGEGLQNVAIPCDSSQECFYLLFHSRLHVHSWLLTMQCVIVAFQIVVLLRSTYWYQILSISIFLAFNYFVLYKLLYNRLLCRKVPVLTT